MEFTAEQIAGILEGEIQGNPKTVVNDLSKIEEGRKGTLSFWSNPKYEEYIYVTESSICIVNNTFEPQRNLPENLTLIKVDDAYACFAKLLELYGDLYQKESGIETPSFIDESASIGENCHVGAFSYIAKNATIGDNVVIYPNAYIGENVSIETGTKIYPNVTDSTLFVQRFLVFDAFCVLIIVGCIGTFAAHSASSVHKSGLSAFKGLGILVEWLGMIFCTFKYTEFAWTNPGFAVMTFLPVYSLITCKQIIVNMTR